MARPKISDEIMEKVEEWIRDNPGNGIDYKNKAIEYLVSKGIESEERKNLPDNEVEYSVDEVDSQTEKAIRKIVKEELEDKP